VQARAAALTVLVAVGLRLAYGPGHLGYDAVWSLEWAREALHGSQPSFEAFLAPTPHPLANAVSLLLAPLRGGAFAVAMALSWLSFAALGVLVFLLGRRQFSVWVGLAAAIVVVTRELLIRETQQAVLDLPFLALVTGALLAEVSRPRERTLVPVLLLLAGLLRPEAWLLGLAWLAYAARGHPRAQVLRWAALVAAAPLLWAVWDLAVTGDPLWSLHGTQDLAEQLKRPRDPAAAFSAVPSYLRLALGTPYVWLGLAGAAAGLLGFYERSLLPATLAAAGILGFLALGIAHLPLLIRYLLVPAVMLCLFCGLLAFGWTALPRGDPAWRAWLAAGVLSLAVAAAFVPRQADIIESVRGAAAITSVVQDDLHSIADMRAVRAAVARCGDLYVPDGRPRALLSYWLGRSPDSIKLSPDWTSRQAPRGVVVAYADADSAGPFSLISPAPPTGSSALPAGGHHVARNASWLVVSGC
jgi:MFS family permease